MKKKGKSIVLICAAVLPGLCAAAFVALLLVSGVFEKSKYLEPWDKKYADRFDDPRLKLAAAGLLAANGHNMQPWLIKLDETDPMIFYLYADGSRRTDEVDPYARQFMVTQGTFLAYVETAGEELGFRAGIALFPDGEYDEGNLVRSMAEKPVARITLTKTEPRHTPFYDAMFLPDTNRGPYKADKPSAWQLEAFRALPMDIGLTLRMYQDAEDLKEIGGYALRGAEAEAGVERVMRETDGIFRANEYQKNRYRYGFSVEGQGMSGLTKHVMQGLLTVFPGLNSGKGSADNFMKFTRASINGTPAYVMILTAGNSRAEQVQSGMLYSRVVLAANANGLAVQPLSQALEEYPEMKAVYDGIHRDYAPNGETIQMLARIGTPEKAAPLSMRRDAADLLMND
jgi:hypothetical protein